MLDKKEFAQAIALILIEAVLIASILAGAFYLFGQGVRKAEKIECIKWQQQAVDYAAAGYYVADWQVKQCEVAGIFIPATAIK
jgi:hypothetical protein